MEQLQNSCFTRLKARTFFFLTDIPDDSCVCLQKDFNAM